jgi:hypothetical protein
MNSFDIEVCITNFIDGKPQPSENEPTIRLICKTSKGEKIAFWGSQDEGTRNIDSLKNQKLPVLIECQVYEPSDYLKKKYNLTYTVPEHSWITINPEV